jgi:hypothetical protein
VGNLDYIDLALFTHRGEAAHPLLQVGRSSLAVKAEHYRRPQSLGDSGSQDGGLATEIAQFPLGDLTFKVHYPHYIYSSALV